MEEKKKNHHLKKAICYDFDFVKDMYLKNIKKTRWQRLLLPELPNWQEPKPHTLSPSQPSQGARGCAMVTVALAHEANKDKLKHWGGARHPLPCGRS